jgi:hypothetical protein
MRMLVDIAERSLADSPFLDPTTAVQAVDRLHDCLSPQVSRRLQAALKDLITVAPPERREVLEHQRDLLAATTAAAMKDERDVKLAPRKTGKAWAWPQARRRSARLPHTRSPEATSTGSSPGRILLVIAESCRRLLDGAGG